MAEYADFEILVQPRQGDVYPVTVLRSAAGEAKGEIRLSAADVERLRQDARAFRAAVTRTSRGVEPEAAPPEAQPDVADRARDLGGALFAALFTGDIRSRLVASRAVTRGPGLRLRLRIEPPELAVLPWELLWDPEQREHVALSRKTPVVRYVPVGQPPERRRRARALRMLAADASPAALPKLDVGREQERLDTALRGLRAKRLLDVDWYHDATEEGLRQRLTQPCDIFHFAGHGGIDPETGAGYLALCDGDGWARLDAQELARLLRDNDDLRLLVLNSCEGAAGAQDAMSTLAVASLHAGVPAVLAMQSVISDDAAVELSRVVYGAVAAGRPVDEALAEARQALAMAKDHPGAWATPVLYLRAPDGRLFERPRPVVRWALAALGLVAAAAAALLLRSFNAVVRVVDEHGEPVRGAEVSWQRGSEPPVHAVTDERGEVFIPNVPGHARRFLRPVRIRAAAAAWEPVEVAPPAAAHTTVALCWRAKEHCYYDPDRPMELAFSSDLPATAWELHRKDAAPQPLGAGRHELQLGPDEREGVRLLRAILPAGKRANVRWEVLQSGARICGGDRVVDQESHYFLFRLRPRRCDALEAGGALAAPAPARLR